MKRSEMVHLLTKNIKIKTNEAKILFNLSEKEANAVLEVIEKAGMLPPGSSIFGGINEWEPEDE
jgi:flagellar motor protein MotB